MFKAKKDNDAVSLSKLEKKNYQANDSVMADIYNRLSDGREAFAGNLRRAAELISVPDERILEIYNALRPYRSTKEELLNINGITDININDKLEVEE